MSKNHKNVFKWKRGGLKLGLINDLIRQALKSTILLINFKCYGK